jgi:hypothetical protein
VVRSTTALSAGDHEDAVAGGAGDRDGQARGLKDRSVGSVEDERVDRARVELEVADDLGQCLRSLDVLELT